MELKSNQASPVVADTSFNMTRLGGVRSSALLPCSQQDAPLSPDPTFKKPGRRNSFNLDDVRCNGWLDAMKASSPTRKKLFANEGNVEYSPSNDDSTVSEDYQSWMAEYPSAIESFGQITTHAKSKKIAVFLDYDGTLSPIVDDPDCAFMSSAMRKTVQSVAKFFPTAIISGRSRDKVHELVKLKELYYAGSHGMDIIGPVDQAATSNGHPSRISSTHHVGKELNLFQPAIEFIPMIDEVFKALVESTKDIVGSKIEHHKFCVSVHYRNIEEKNWSTVAQCVHDILTHYPRLRLTHGRKVLEVRPVIDWNKGKAVEFLLEALGLTDTDDVLPIYIGDDKTDEDAFKVLRERGSGFGILVSSIRKETVASYSLRDPNEVMKFLQLLVYWKRQEGSI